MNDILDRSILDNAYERETELLKRHMFVLTELKEIRSELAHLHDTIHQLKRLADHAQSLQSEHD